MFNISNRRHDEKDFSNEHKDKPFFMLGIGLYWGEGAKSLNSQRLEITNADPKLIKVWVKWLHTYLPQLEIRGCIFGHSDVDTNNAVSYWQQVTGIHNVGFWRAIPKSSKGKSKNLLPHGTFRVVARKGAVEYFHKMMVWLELAGVV